MVIVVKLLGVRGSVLYVGGCRRWSVGVTAAVFCLLKLVGTVWRGIVSVDRVGCFRTVVLIVLGCRLVIWRRLAGRVSDVGLGCCLGDPVGVADVCRCG